MAKKNCWDITKCGRETGGDKVSELGECPTVHCFKAHSLNDGINGGRACWAIAGTYCQGKIQGTFANKIRDCANCEVFLLVVKEEDNRLVPVPAILERIENPLTTLPPMP